MQTGDRIRLDLPNRRLDLRITAEEFNRRREAWQPNVPHPGSDRGYLSLYLNQVMQAEDGCDFQFMRPLDLR